MSRIDYEIVTICGSMRWIEDMYEAAQFESRSGNIVLMPFVTFPKEIQTTDTDKLMLDELHFDKIDLSNRILVITNDCHYVGDSTFREIQYAESTGKTISYWNNGRQG